MKDIESVREKGEGHKKEKCICSGKSGQKGTSSYKQSFFL